MLNVNNEATVKRTQDNNLNGTYNYMTWDHIWIWKFISRYGDGLTLKYANTYFQGFRWTVINFTALPIGKSVLESSLPSLQTGDIDIPLGKRVQECYCFCSSCYMFYQIDFCPLLLCPYLTMIQFSLLPIYPPIQT